MSVYLGLDGGGTKTASVILNEVGEELGRGRGGPCNIATCSDEQLRESISEARETALNAAGLPPDSRFECACAGVAGFTAKRRRAEFAALVEMVVPAARYRVEPDYVIAYWGATEGEPGIIVSAGTGAVVYGRNAEGGDCRIDGRGFLLGDRGSANYIGRGFLRQLTFRLDRGSALTELDTIVMHEIGAEDADDIVEWTYRDFSAGKVASIAQILSKCANEGNKRARDWFTEAGWALRDNCERARIMLNMAADIPVYLLGGLWQAGDPILSGFRLENRLKRPPVPVINEPLHDAAYGAALLAKQDTG